MEQFDALAARRGWPPDRMRRHAGMWFGGGEMAQRGKYRGRHCLMPLDVASAEVVAGKNSPAFLPSRRAHAGATYRDAAVVVDGNLITSRQPADLPAFSAPSFAGRG